MKVALRSVLLLVFVAAAIVACGGGDDGNDAQTPAASPTAAPTHLPGGVKVKTWEEKGQAIRQTGEAWKQGALAVHQPLVKTGQTDQTWTITHLPTGLSAVSAIKTQVEAIKGVNIDKITVWDSGANGEAGSSTANFASSLIKTLPPLHEVAKMAGLELPEYLGAMSAPAEGPPKGGTPQGVGSTQPPASAGRSPGASEKSSPRP